MEQILTIQEEFERLIVWFKEMFNYEEKIDDFSGEKKISFSLPRFKFIDIQEGESRLGGGSVFLRVEYTADGGCSYRAYLECGAELEQIELIPPNGHRQIIPRNAFGDRELIDLHNDNTRYPKARPKTEYYRQELFSNDVKARIALVNLLKKQGTRLRITANPWNRFSFVGTVFHPVTTETSIVDTDLEHVLSMLYTFDLYGKISNKDGQVSFDTMMDNADSATIEVIENTIDDNYDYFKVVYEKYKDKIAIISEKKKQTKKRKVELAQKKEIDSLLKAIGNNVNVQDADTIEMLLTNPLEINDIAKLKNYCDEKFIQNDKCKWLDTFNENYDKESILKDVRTWRKRKNSLNKTRQTIGWVLLGLACTLFGTCCKFVYQEHQESGYAIACFATSIVIGLLGTTFFVEKNLKYSDYTNNFINDFQKQFPKE